MASAAASAALGHALAHEQGAAIVDRHAGTEQQGNERKPEQDRDIAAALMNEAL